MIFSNTYFLSLEFPNRLNNIFSNSQIDIYSTEAIALYDYKGRSEKEISFKKGTILAIKGQLSADWWQGCLLSSQNSSETPKLGYIPDKYIALRSNAKRYNY